MIIIQVIQYAPEESAAFDAGSRFGQRVGQIVMSTNIPTSREASCNRILSKATRLRVPFLVPFFLRPQERNSLPFLLIPQ